MNKAQLEVIRLNNEDVIVTSCKSAYGFMIVFKEGYSGATNGYREGSKGTEYEGNDHSDIINFSDYNNEYGLYHFHINNSGKIELDEKCEGTDSSIFDENHHDLKVSR